MGSILILSLLFNYVRIHTAQGHLKLCVTRSGITVFFGVRAVTFVNDEQDSCRKALEIDLI